MLSYGTSGPFENVQCCLSTSPSHSNCCGSMPTYLLCSSVISKAHGKSSHAMHDTYPKFWPTLDVLSFRSTGRWRAVFWYRFVLRRTSIKHSFHLPHQLALLSPSAPFLAYILPGRNHYHSHSPHNHPLLPLLLPLPVHLR